jgi:hypothetical protein
MHNFRPLLGALGAALLSLPLLASDFYVAPTGSASASGSVTSPWDLATALAQPSAVKPGDSIWLRGGTYTGHFVSSLKGSKGKPIVVRQYPGERATLDGNYGGNEVTLTVNGQYAWFWGFEVTNSDPTRTSASSDNPARRGTGVHLLGPGTKLINAVVHDAAEGVLTTALAPDAEVYGNVLYYNGYDGPDRGHGHGVYVQNDTGTKRVVDNVIFGQFGIGIHGYTEGGKLDDIHIEGNTSFANGVLSQVTGPTIDILVGANGSAADSPGSSSKVAKRTFLVSNYTYFVEGGTGVNLGFSKGIASPTLLDNYLVAEQALALVNAFRPIQMSGNTVIGDLSGLTTSEFSANTFLASRPAGQKVFVRKNQYEPGRANITVYNWDRAATASVPLQGVLENGTDYELRNAQNFFGPPVLSGTYQGSPLAIPLSGLAVAAPIGRPAPAATGPDFQVFVLIPKRPTPAGKPPAAAFTFGPAVPFAGLRRHVREPRHGWGRLARVGLRRSRLRRVERVDARLAGPRLLRAGRVHGAADRLERLRARACGARRVVVTDQTGRFSATLPVAGHVTGSTGTTFVTTSPSPTGRPPRPPRGWSSRPAAGERRRSCPCPSRPANRGCSRTSSPRSSVRPTRSGLCGSRRTASSSRRSGSRAAPTSRRTPERSASERPACRDPTARPASDSSGTSRRRRTSARTSAR